MTYANKNEKKGRFSDKICRKICLYRRNVVTLLSIWLRAYMQAHYARGGEEVKNQVMHSYCIGIA